MQASTATDATSPANRIAQCRKAKDLKLSEVAGVFRVDQSTVHRWEKTGRVPVDRLPELARMLDVSIDYLMGWDASAEAEA